LDYIKDLGFDAIWISPIVDNYDNGYHGYWARKIYEVNSHFGTKDDLKRLVTECHKRDIWVMVDVVGNHMGNTDTYYGNNAPFTSTDHYHSYC
jgi:alpha-amylase